MRGKFKIDELSIFFVLAITFLLLSSGKELLTYEERNTGLQSYFDFESAVQVPAQGLLDPGDEVIVYDPSVELMVSIDGGETFKSAGIHFNPVTIENPDLTQIPISYHWQQPIGDFPGAKNIIFKLKNNTTGAVSVPEVYTWFTERSELPVVSLSVPQADIYHEAEGMMVFGKESWKQEGFYESWWFRSANFTSRGLTSEREVFMQYFEDNELKYQQSCGLRISGHATRGFPQKSMRLVARKTYGNDRFEFPFFGSAGQKKYQSLVIRNSGNDNSKTLFADLLMHRLADSSHVLTQQGKPIRVYLNGNYWGIYNLRERIDEYFIARVEDVKEDEVTILEGAYGDLKDGREKGKIEFDAIMTRCDVEVMEDELLSELGNSIDLQSFTDYIIFETFFGNTDWPANNSTWYKAERGKWKWVLNDLDYGLAYLGPGQVNVNLFDKLFKKETVTAKLFAALISNTSFKEQFIMRGEEILQKHFNKSEVDKAFFELKAIFDKEIDLQINRWRMIPSRDEWEKNCISNRSFLADRVFIYSKQLLELK